MKILLKVKELADKKEAVNQERAKGLNGGLYELEDYLLEENQTKIMELNELAKYNPRYLEETERCAKNLEVLKTYYAYVNYW